MTTWEVCPECGCGKGDEHSRTCSFWHRNRYFGGTWKPSPPPVPIKLMVTGGDYSYSGTLRGIAVKESGAIRYVIEDGNGRLFIHNAKQIGREEGWLP